MKCLVGIGGVTNGGKTTLALRLASSVPNCCVLHQDDFLRSPDEIEYGEDGFKQWDVITSIRVDDLFAEVQRWQNKPQEFFSCHGDHPASADHTHLLIVEGFLLYQYRPLAELFDKRYFITLTYEECLRRRSGRAYPFPDLPGVFDGHVWPMYLKHKSETERSGLEIEYLDGLQPREDVYTHVYEGLTSTLLGCVG